MDPLKFYVLDTEDTSVPSAHNGSYSVVRSKLTNEAYLIKAIPSVYGSAKKPNPHLFDIHYQRSINHPNIQTPKEIYYYRSFYYVVFSKPVGYKLSRLVDEDYFQGEIKIILDIVSQLLSLVQYLHELKLMHRNLNPDIIYINRHNRKVQMIDCGSCCDLKASKERIPTNLLFSSPELATPNIAYDFKTDIYSIGIIFYTLLYNKSPYNLPLNANLEILKNQVIKGKIIEPDQRPRDYDIATLNFLDSFLELYPEDRLSAMEYLNNRYLADKRVDLEKEIRTNYIFKNCFDFTVNDIFSSIIGVYFNLDEEIEVQNIFSVIDQDRSGFIEVCELTQILVINMGDADKAECLAKHLFTLIDFQNNGYMDYVDFATINFRSKAKTFRKFEIFMKQLKITDDFMIEYEYFIRMLEIKDELYLSKLANSVTKQYHFDKDTNSFNIELFFKSLFRSTDKLLTYRAEPWYMNMKRVNKRIILDKELILANLRANLTNEQLMLNIKKIIGTEFKENIKAKLEKERNDQILQTTKLTDDQKIENELKETIGANNMYKNLLDGLDINDIELDENDLMELKKIGDFHNKKPKSLDDKQVEHSMDKTVEEPVNVFANPMSHTINFDGEDSNFVKNFKTNDIDFKYWTANANHNEYIEGDE